MPARPYRIAELHQHRIQSIGPGGYEAARSRYLHPDWPLCAAGCGWPLHPTLVELGECTHPTCEVRVPGGGRRR